MTKPKYTINADTVKTHTDIIREVQKIQQEIPSEASGERVPFDFSKVHIHFGIPCYGGLILESTMTSFIRFVLLANQIGLNWSLDTMSNESLVTRARNNLMAKMMTNQVATHFMFIDADIKFNADDIFRMITTDKDIIAGMYPKKSLPIQYNVNMAKETLVQGSLFTVDTAATGFLMFKRKVYADLIAAHPETKYVDDIGLGKQFEPNMFAIFDCYIDEAGHYLSEDWAFCRRAKALGYDIWTDSLIKLSHLGTFEFAGDLDVLTSKLQ